ncbi:MAG: hypothetical protein DRP42_03930 [Tenericutes bacterium]|nr:MAG: hypothetical protein DRP42_03930 [Mycoplasmatota bacterium]
MNKIFTAYIPTYNPNHGDLKALVDLLLKFKDRIEILILDDVSTPEFRKHLLDNYSDKATIVLNEKNQNKALNNKDAIEKHIKTKYFHPIDPDDLVKQENFEKFLDMLDKSSADLIFNN